MDLFVKIFCFVPILISLAGIIVNLRNRTYKKQEQLPWYKRDLFGLIILLLTVVLFTIGCWFVF